MRVRVMALQTRRIWILGKLRARMAAKARTFLVKIKTQRGAPRNERADDLEEVGRTLDKDGKGYQWKERTTRLVYSYCDRTSHQWKRGTWSKKIRNSARRGAAESLMEDRLSIERSMMSLIFLFVGGSKEPISGDRGCLTPDSRQREEIRWN